MTPSIYLTLSFLIAACVSLILVPLVIRFASAQGLFDGSEHLRKDETHRKVHRGSIPRLGGVAIVFAFLSAISFLPTSLPYQGVLLGSLIIFICGGIDDFIPLAAKSKLLVQIAAASFAIYHDHLALTQIVITKQIVWSLPNPISFIFSVFFVVGSINAINLIDGLDGLAAGVVLIGISLLAFADFVATHNANALLPFALPMIGAIFGFLRYNTHPATIFMGDGGSNWLGFMSGALLLVALRTHNSINESVPFVSIILTFAVPIIDTGAVMLLRIRQGKSPFTADKNHFHHTLLRIGLSHSQSVTTIYFLAFACGVLGIFPAIFPKYDFPWIPYSIFTLLFLVIPASSKLDDDAVSAALATHSRFSRSPMSLKFSNVISYWENSNRYLLFAILILGPAFSGQIPKEFAIWALTSISVLIASTFIPHSKRGSVFFDSFAICAASVIILVINNLNPMFIGWDHQKIALNGLYNSLFIVLFLSSTFLFLITARRRSLIFTPSDFLLLTIPLAILLLPKGWQAEYKLDLISLRSLVIFMSMRVLYRRRPKHIGNLKFACITALLWVYMVAQYSVRVLY